MVPQPERVLGTGASMALGDPIVVVTGRVPAPTVIARMLDYLVQSGASMGACQVSR